MNHFANNIALLLKEHKLNQEQFGIIIGKKRSVVGSYIRGESQPNIDIVLMISKYFKISLDDLISNDLSKINLQDMTPLELSEDDSILYEIKDKIDYIYNMISKKEAISAIEELKKLVSNNEDFKV